MIQRAFRGHRVRARLWPELQYIKRRLAAFKLNRCVLLVTRGGCSMPGGVTSTAAPHELVFTPSCVCRALCLSSGASERR